MRLRDDLRNCRKLFILGLGELLALRSDRLRQLRWSNTYASSSNDIRVSSGVTHMAVRLRRVKFLLVITNLRWRWLPGLKVRLSRQNRRCGDEDKDQMHGGVD